MQHEVVWGVGLGTQAHSFNHILTDWEDQTGSCARKKSRKIFSITKEKIRVKKEIGCPLKLFLEGNRVIFTLILFSKDDDSKFKKSIYNLKAVVSNGNLKAPNRLWHSFGEHWRAKKYRSIPSCHPLLCSSHGQAHVFCWLVALRCAVSSWLGFL